MTIVKHTVEYFPGHTPRNRVRDVMFNIVKEGGIYCASDVNKGIFTYARTKAELMENINKAVECYFNVPRGQIQFRFRNGKSLEGQDNHYESPDGSIRITYIFNNPSLMNA